MRLTAYWSTHQLGIAVLSVGDSVCVNGQYTGGCDKIDDLGWSKTIDGKAHSSLGITRGVYDTIDGDSGGPLYVQNSPHIIAGYVQGSKRNWAGSQYQTFSQANLLDYSNLGLTNIASPPAHGVRDYVQALYMRGLGRVPDSGGYWHFAGIVQSDCPNGAKVAARSILGSPEFKNRVPLTSRARAEIRVEIAYRTLLGRRGDSGGLAHFTSILWSNPTESDWNSVVESMLSSPEFQHRLTGRHLTVDGWIC